MTRFVIRPDVALRLARENAVVSSDHQLLAPILRRVDGAWPETFDDGMGSRACTD